MKYINFTKKKFFKPIECGKYQGLIVPTALFLLVNFKANLNLKHSVIGY